MRTCCFLEFRSKTLPTTLNALIFRHVIRDATATDCVDSGIGFFHGEAVEDYANAGIGHAVGAGSLGHE